GVQKPHIPLWIGGGGERVTLKLVAKWGDACNITATLDAEDSRHKLDVLRQHCETVGRDYDSVMKTAHVFMTLVGPGETAEEVTADVRARMGKAQGREVSLEEYKQRIFTGTPAETADYLNALKETGIEYMIFYFRNDLTRLDTLQLFAEEVVKAMR